VDHRTDIFSLGVILYEMATGKRPFGGDSSADVMSSILRDAPQPVVALNHEVPHDLARIIHHCLEKDPNRRFQTALDLRNELEDLERELHTDHQPAGRRPWPGRDLSPQRGPSSGPSVTNGSCRTSSRFSPRSRWRS
jgi:serine/threonine-protein kinase